MPAPQTATKSKCRIYVTEQAQDPQSFHLSDKMSLIDLFSRSSPLEKVSFAKTFPIAHCPSEH